MGRGGNAERTDPWTLALERHFAPAEPEPPPGRRGLLLTPARLVAACAGVLLLLAGVGVLGTLAVVNHQRSAENLERADAWSDRSERLRELLAERTADLNRQTARLNVASNRLRDARASVRRSEEDVATLEGRQRELAAEKAAVEDARARLALERDALGGIATELGLCNEVLLDLVLAVDGGYANDGHVTRVDQRCGEARASLDEHAATFGSP